VSVREVRRRRTSCTGTGASPSDALVTPSDALVSPSDAVVTPSDALVTPSDALVTAGEPRSHLSQRSFERQPALRAGF
jgi:hypothetical protein